MLFPETERTAMDLVLTRGESAFDPLDTDRFQTETRGLLSVQVAREKEKHSCPKKVEYLPSPSAGT